MIGDQDKGFHRGYYDSYRPAASSKIRSPTIATEPEAVRYHSSKRSHLAKSSSNTTTPQGDTSSTLISLRAQSRDHSPPAVSVPDKKSPSTGHDPDQLVQMPLEGRRDISMPDTTPSRRSSTVDHDNKNESEAQSRGFYGSSRSPTSNVIHLGRYELKRPGDDEAADRSLKRRRDLEEEKDDEDKDKPVRASDNNRPPERNWCKNYMCMEDHAYQDCDKPKICWGCRSTSHYWPLCPMTCTNCSKERHTARYCEDFELTASGQSQPRVCNPRPPTEPASYRARKESLEHMHGEKSLPKKPVKVVIPSRDISDRRQASRNVLDPRSSSRLPSQVQKPAPVEQGVSETTTDRYLQPLRDTPIPGANPKGPTGTISTSDHLTISTQVPGKLATPPSTRPSISPRDPRLRRGSASTPLVSPLQSLQVSLEPGEVLKTQPQMLGEPPSDPSRRRPLEVGAIPTQASARQEEYQPYSSNQRQAYVPPASSGKKEHVSQGSSRKDEDHPPALTQNEDHSSRAPSQVHDRSSQSPTCDQDHLIPASAPNEHSDDSLDIIEARMKAFEEEERVKQKQHEEELAQRKRQQEKEFEHELEGKINQKKQDADRARKEAIQKQEEKHERRLAELRRR